MDFLTEMGINYLQGLCVGWRFSLTDAWTGVIACGAQEILSDLWAPMISILADSVPRSFLLIATFLLNQPRECREKIFRKLGFIS